MTGEILLTGATGFVGRQVLRVLTERKRPVRAVVREGTQPRLLSSGFATAAIVTPDLFAEDTEWYSEVCRDIDTVIHIAWNVEPGSYLTSAKNLDSLIGTLKLAKGAAKAGVRRWVGIGTCFEYDLDAGHLSIQTPLRPLTPYASAKAAAFMALSEYFPLQDVEFAWCRLFYLYGEGEDRQRLVPYLRGKLASGEPAELTSGNQVRDYLDVREAGQMIVDVALGREEGPVNICSGVPITIRQLAENVADEYGRRDLLRFGARPDNFTDPPFVLGMRKEPVS